LFGLDTCVQGGEWEFVGADSVERGEELSQNEVPAAHGATSLDGEQVLDAGDDAQEMPISPVVGADSAYGAIHRDFCQVAAAFTGAEAIFQNQKLRAQIGRQIWIRHQLQSKPLRRLLADAREATEKLNDATEGFGQHGIRNKRKMRSAEIRRGDVLDLGVKDLHRLAPSGVLLHGFDGSELFSAALTSAEGAQG